MNRVKIKICGLRRTEDIEAVNYAMPDYIGFVFAKSKRQINADTAKYLKKRLDKRILAVGVFVNQPLDFIIDLYRKGIIALAQLHGDENDEYMNELRHRCGCKIIKSIGIASKLPVLPKAADYLLFDKASEQRGGTGATFNWDAIAYYQEIPYFLAGGLMPENIKEALQRLSPFGVDVSSGVETNGFKDADKINKFMQIIKEIAY